MILFSCILNVLVATDEGADASDENATPPMQPSPCAPVITSSEMQPPSQKPPRVPSKRNIQLLGVPEDGQLMTKPPVSLVDKNQAILYLADFLSAIGSCLHNAIDIYQDCKYHY